MSRFRSRVVEIQAVQLLWSTWSEVCALTADNVTGKGIRGVQPSEARALYPDCELTGALHAGIYAVIPSIEGPHLAREGDWIVRGLEGEVYACIDSVFQRKYELIPEVS